MTQLPGYTGGYAIPSMQTVLEGVENQPWFGKWEMQLWLGDTVSGATRDAGNTVTTLLRSGLLLGRVTSSGLLKEWNPTGTDGSQDIYGVLGGMLHAQMGGSNMDRYAGFIQVGGSVYSDRIIVPGTAAEGIVGHALEFQIVNQLSRRFLFDRHLQMSVGGPLASRYRYLTAAEIAADAVTVTTADHGRIFLMTGADATTTFTLPAAQVGLMFTVFANVATHKAAIALASGSIKGPDADGTFATCDLNTGESATFVGTAAGEYQMIMQSESTTD